MPIKVRYLMGEPTPLDVRSALLWLSEGDIAPTKDQYRSLDAFLRSRNTTYGFLTQRDFLEDLERFMHPTPPATASSASVPLPPNVPPPPNAPPPQNASSVAAVPKPSREAVEQARAFRARNVRLNVLNKNDPIPMGGTLGVMNTAGGSEESLIKYFELKAINGCFPYRWRIVGTDYEHLVKGEKVVARAVIDTLTTAKKDWRGRTTSKLNDMVPNGKVPFVIVHMYEVYIGPMLRVASDTQGAPFTVNHLHIAELNREVIFAGQLRFDGGKLEEWSADSGGYACTNAQALKCGLPMKLYTVLYPDEISRSW